MWSVLLDGIIHRNPLLFLLWNFWILHCNRYHGLRSVTSYSDPYNVCWWEFFRLAFVSSVGSLINEFRSIFLPYLTPVSCCAIEKLRLHTLCYTSGKLAAILQNPLEYRPCSFHRTVPPVHILIWNERHLLQNFTLPRPEDLLWFGFPRFDCRIPYCYRNVNRFLRKIYKKF